MNNNQMESFNENTIRHREKVVRGLKKEDSVILTGLQLYHNFVMPHLGLNGKTPAEVAGIKVEGNNKILTMIKLRQSPQTDYIRLYRYLILLYVMNNTDTKLEDMIVPSKWTDKDDDIVVRAMIYRELGLKPKAELD